MTSLAVYRVIRTTAITMADSAALLRLMSWLSPAFPVGSFAYSHGLERAIHDGLIRDRATLVDWLSDLVTMGSGWNDAVLLAEAWRREAAGEDVSEVAELAEALAGSRERHMETTLQGSAFGEAVMAWGNIDRPLSVPASPVHLSPAPLGRGTKATPYPIAVGIAAAQHGISLNGALTAYLHAFTSNLIQASVRLVPLGQRDGVAALAALEPVILATAECAAASTIDDIGSCTVMSDILSMNHETQYSRVFRS